MKNRSWTFVTSLITGPLVAVCALVSYIYSMATVDVGAKYELGALAIPFEIGGIVIVLLIASLLSWGVYRKERSALVASAVYVFLGALFLLFLLSTMWGTTGGYWELVPYVLVLVVYVFALIVYVRELRSFGKSKSAFK